jgi:membrane-bound lytic murein transglycosylase F
VAALLLMLVHWADLAQRYPRASRLERVQRAGTLRVAMPVDPGIDHAAFQDMHHALLREFANRLDVNLSLVEAQTQAQMLDMVARDEVDLALPARPLPPSLPRHFRVAPAYYDSQTHLVCNRVAQRVTVGLERRDIRVSSSDGYIPRLAAAGIPGARLLPAAPQGTVALLERVADGSIGCTLAQADEVARARQRLPNLQLGPAIGPVGSIGWLSRSTRDDTLTRQVDRFLLQARKSGLLAQLRQQERGLLRRFDVVDFQGFRLALATKLPRYEDAFRRAGSKYGIDWRLLAALAYQESRLNPTAESPHGAGGLMMLVTDTARAMGCRDRFDAVESINAAARYLAALREDLSPDVDEPHRTWMMLAAYNLGPDGLARARTEVAAGGGNPGRWPEVRRVLPTLRSGARGWEPVYHVESVRRYFALLSVDGLSAGLHITPRRDGSGAGVVDASKSALGPTRHKS